MSQTIDAKTLQQWREQGQVSLVDVRSTNEHRLQHIPDSQSIPLEQLTPERLNALGATKVVLYCQTGQRSDTAYKKISADFSEELYVLSGGLGAWKQASYEVYTAPGFSLPINQQVQITIGGLVLISCLLAYSIHPAFIGLAAFFGAGLMFAGITGFCGLAKLMEKLPWNHT